MFIISLTYIKPLEEVDAQYLISSLDTAQDSDAQAQWSELAKKRFESLENGDVQSVSWESIKNQILGS